MQGLARQESKSTPRYSRRRPELTPIYRIIQDHYETFAAAREAENRLLPDYVTAEFEAYLRCGILAHGFLRLRCRDCDEEMVVAFSCKKRGFCPSCAARRSAEAATHLVDHVLPVVPYRQFVVTFPLPLRFWLHTNRELFNTVHRIVVSSVQRYYTATASSLGIDEGAAGTISFRQNWGSALNLNPHLHILCPDGVYTRSGEAVRFHRIGAISGEAVAALLEGVVRRVIRLLRRRGYLDEEGRVIETPPLDAVYSENESIAAALSGGASGRVAFGPQAGRRLTRIGGGFGWAEEIPLAKGLRCYSVNGFSIHAGTSVNAHQRDRLRKLVEYISRGPLSNERVEYLSKNRVRLRLKSRWYDRTTHLEFTPEEFIGRLAAMVPVPRSHLVRWGGVFAPHSPYRPLITVNPEVKKGFQFDDGETEGVRPINYTWSRMLAQVFAIDVLICKKCGGELYAVCAVTEPESVGRYLRHMGVEDTAPARAPPRLVQEGLGLEGVEASEWSDEVPVISID